MLLNIHPLSEPFGYWVFVSICKHRKDDVSWYSDTFSTYIHDLKLSGTGLEFPFICLVSNTRTDVSWYSHTFSTYIYDGKLSVTGFVFPFVSLVSNTRSDVSWNSDTFSTYIHDGNLSGTGFDFPFVSLVRMMFHGIRTLFQHTSTMLTFRSLFLIFHL